MVLMFVLYLDNQSVVSYFFDFAHSFLMSNFGSLKRRKQIGMFKKAHKVDKEFRLTDSTENSKGFRVLTSGYQLAEFERNPIGYYMHERTQGVLLKWVDFRLADDAVYAKPVINLSHPRGQQTVDEIEDGFLNAASIGHLVALEISTDASDLLPNQKGPTLKKWFNRECSLVDIPGNYNSLVLMDLDDNPINLADFTNPKIEKEMEIKFTTAQLLAMGLSADATDTLAVSTAFDNLVAKANKATALETELSDLKATTVAKEVKGKLAQAVIDKKMTVELSAKLEKDYATNPDGLSDLIAALPVYTSISSAVASDPKVKRLSDLSAMTYEDLDKKGLLKELKNLSEETFTEKKAEYLDSLKK